MKRNEVTHCLLCNVVLVEEPTWTMLLSSKLPKTICSECEGKFEPAETNTDENLTYLYKYNEAMKDFIHRYKFMHDVLLAKVVRDKIREKLYRTKAIIIPIPMHPLKLKERTFAHVDELLKAANIPFQHHLEKITTEAQSEKSRQERLNTPQIFKLREGTDVRNKEILLVDDIYTTGTTMNHARRILLEAGAKSVKAFTLIKG